MPLAPLEVKAGESKILPGVNAELLEIRAKLKISTPTVVTFNVRGIPVVYDAAAGEISVKDVRLKARTRDGELDVTIFVDRTTVEVFCLERRGIHPCRGHSRPGKQKRGDFLDRRECKVQRAERFRA